MGSARWLAWQLHFEVPSQAAGRPDLSMNTAMNEICWIIVCSVSISLSLQGLHLVVCRPLLDTGDEGLLGCVFFPPCYLPKSHYHKLTTSRSIHILVSMVLLGASQFFSWHPTYLEGSKLEREHGLSAHCCAVNGSLFPAEHRS